MSNTTTDQLSVAHLDRHAIERVYARFASVYNTICGPILHAGRREAMRQLPLTTGDSILEVGIGTGLTATLYPSDCRVIGIDLSEPMLREAARHLESHGRTNVRLWRMDASSLAFPDESFDVVYAAYVISVVPDPISVLNEMRRVCRVGGHIVLLNHFLSSGAILSTLERWISPLTARAGFRADLDLSMLLEQARLQVVSVRKVNTPKIWSLVHCRRQDDVASEDADRTRSSSPHS
jgi:phosphatidylethanolamine/phosphatidyl-N-methylethanolamine N-methyltransferase